MASTRTRHPLLEPIWVVSHVVVLAVLVTFPMLGMWQLDRWDQEKALADRLEARLDATPVPLDEVLDADISEAEADALEFTPVTVSGTWLVDDEVAHRNRALEGRSGFDWLTPLLLDDGRAVLVRRGWVPPTRPAGGDPTPAPPQGGTVTVTGWLERSGQQPGFGPSDADEGPLETVFQPDVARIDQQVDAGLLPMLVHLVSADPATTAELPIPQPRPEVDLTQNLSYAVQWFTFTAIVAIGYAIVLRRRVRGADLPSADAA